MKNRRTIYIYNYLFFFILFCIPRHALAYHRIDTITKLKEVVVVANQRSTIIPSQILSGEMLKGLSSYNVADAIRYFSGVQIKDYGGIGGLKTVNIRGMGSEHVGVFYNGIQITNAQNGQVDLGRFSMDNVEAISLYNGQKSDILQPAKDFATSSSIYIRSRVPKFSQNKKQNIKASIKVGSFGLIDPSILYERKINSTISLSTNIEYLYANGKYNYRYVRNDIKGNTLYDTTAIRHNGDVKAFRAESGLFGKAKDYKYNVRAYYYNSERGIPGAIVNNRWLNSQRQWDRDAFIQTEIQKDVSTNYRLKLSAKYSYDYMRYYNPDTTLKIVDNNYHQQELYISLANQWKVKPSLSLSLSSDLQYNKLRSNIDRFIFPRRYTILNALSSSYKYKGYSIQGSLLHTLVFDRINSKNSSINNIVNSRSAKSILTPSIFMGYSPSYIKGLNIRAFYKYIFRMPTFNDIYYSDLVKSDLKPEFTHQYDIGTTYTSQNIQSSWFNNYNLQIDAYFNRVTNKIIAVPKGSGQFRWQMMNIGYVEVKGLDISSSSTFILFPSSYLNLKLSYSYQRVQDLTKRKSKILTSYTYGGQIAYMPIHSGSLLASWRYNG